MERAGFLFLLALDSCHVTDSRKKRGQNITHQLTALDRHLSTLIALDAPLCVYECAGLTVHEREVEDRVISTL